MNIFDAILLIVLAVFVIRGIIRGFLHETLGLVGLVLAVLLSVRYLDSAADVLGAFIDLSPSIIAVLAFALIFFSVLVAVRILAAALRNVLKATSLSWLDRTGGLAVGLIKGSILAGALALMFSILPLSPSLSLEREESALLPAFRRVLPTAYNLIRHTWPGTKQFVDELGESFEGKALEGQVERLLESYGRPAQTPPESGHE